MPRILLSVIISLFVIFTIPQVSLSSEILASQFLEGIPFLAANSTPGAMDIISNSSTSYTSGEFTDARDGQIYVWVKIGDLAWMAENLNFDIGDGSWTYNNIPSNGTVYGRLYDWETAVNACPDGWHLPSESEWNLLVVELGGMANAATALRSTSGWDNNGNGDNSSGLGVLPAGYRNHHGSFVGLGWTAGFWTSTPEGTDHAIIYIVPASISEVIPNGESRISAYSVRCVNCCPTLPGDANGDGDVNVGDAVFIINNVFRGGPAPEPLEMGDANCDDSMNVGDAVYLINHIFRGGPGPCQ